MEYKSVRPAQIILDPENPRLPDGTSSDKEAINRLLTEGYDQFLALARDLAEQGESNPTELPILLKDGSKYIVLEGNRRFAALKLLTDPKLADDLSHQTAFTRVKDKGKPPKSVHCAVAESREQADHWIMLRHTGANDGVGVRSWSTSQTATHRRRMKAPVDSGTLRAIALADELTEAYQADDHLVELIKRVRTDKLTNIGRFFAGGVLARLQFELKQVADGDARTLWARHSAAQLHPFFTWAMEFLDGHSVDAFKNDEIRGELLREHGDQLPDAAASLPEPRRLADHPYAPESDPTDDATQGAEPEDDGTLCADGESGDSTPGENSGSEQSDQSGGGGQDSDAAGGRKRDQKPEKYLYSAVKLPNLSGNIQRLIRETKQLSIDDNYATACVLARVVLELTVSDPKVLSWSGSTESATLAEKIKACISALDPEIEKPNKRTRPDLVQAHHEADGIGVAYMHQFMHNPSAKADPHLARRFSTVYSPLLIGINESAK